MNKVTARLLFVRPDTYGDIILFEPVLRLLRAAFPQITLAVLIREQYGDITPLFADRQIEWLTTTCEPYREGPREARAELERLREVVGSFRPDWLIAPCFEHTWIEAALASFL